MFYKGKKVLVTGGSGFLGKLHAAENELPAFRLIGRFIPQNLSYFKSNSQTSCHVNGVCRV